MQAHLGYVTVEVVIQLRGSTIRTEDIFEFVRISDNGRSACGRLRDVAGGRMVSSGSGVDKVIVGYHLVVLIGVCGYGKVIFEISICLRLVSVT